MQPWVASNLLRHGGLERRDLWCCTQRHTPTLPDFSGDQPWVASNLLRHGGLERRDLWCCTQRHTPTLPDFSGDPMIMHE
jgi:hypothetical protein